MALTKKRSHFDEQEIISNSTKAMKLTETINDLKWLVLFSRIWFWASVHSPDFCYCQVCFHFPLIEVEFSKLNPRYEFLRIQITFNYPKLTVSIPWNTCLAFIKARKESGEIIDERTIDEIPF